MIKKFSDGHNVLNLEARYMGTIPVKPGSSSTFKAYTPKGIRMSAWVLLELFDSSRYQYTPMGADRWFRDNGGMAVD